MLKVPQDVLIEIKRRVAEVTPNVVEVRRYLHRHPERSKREKETSDLVANHLARLGHQPVRGTAVHSVTSVLKGRADGKTVALRADMDALKLQEQSGLSFASEVPEVMHACGHDAHTAILLGVAGVLTAMRDTFPGNVKFLFQPSEEAFPGGALPMVQEGVMEAPHVDAALALHVDATQPTGQVSVCAGPSMGGVTSINLKVKGVGGHFAGPYEAVDPIVVGAHVIVGLQSMVTRQLDYREPFVLTFGQFLGGTRDNVIPGEVIIRGDMGSINDKMREDVEQNIERTVKGITAAFGASYELKFWRGYPTLINDAGMVEVVREVAGNRLGAGNVKLRTPRMDGEDFAFFAQKAPAAMFHLGAWDTAKHKTPIPHHDPRFDLDEACLPLGVELLTTMALEYLYRNA